MNCRIKPSGSTNGEEFGDWLKNLSAYPKTVLRKAGCFGPLKTLCRAACVTTALEQWQLIICVAVKSAPKHTPL